MSLLYIYNIQEYTYYHKIKKTPKREALDAQLLRSLFLFPWPRQNLPAIFLHSQK